MLIPATPGSLMAHLPLSNRPLYRGCGENFENRPGSTSVSMHKINLFVNCSRIESLGPQWHLLSRPYKSTATMGDCSVGGTILHQ